MASHKFNLPDGKQLEITTPIPRGASSIRYLPDTMMIPWQGSSVRMIRQAGGPPHVYNPSDEQLPHVVATIAKVAE